MKVSLELQQQSSNIRRVTVRHDIVIGRGSDCNLRVSAPQVSRRHCFLRIDSNGVAITDLESCNGTWLNGQKTVPGKRYYVEDGMKVAVGPVCFVARITADETETTHSDESVARASQQHNPALSPDLMRAGSMDFAIEHAGDAAEEDELTIDYSTHKEAAAVLDSSEIEIVDSDSEEEVILVDDATQTVGGSVSVEAVEMVVAVDAIDDDDTIIPDDAVDDDGNDALNRFIRKNG